MFRFDEDLMAERLSGRFRNPTASKGGNYPPHRTMAAEKGLRGPVLIS
jgi:hypothetical protein